MTRSGVIKGTCAICFRREVLVIDHDHETGNERGLICGHCNTGLGFFRDDPKALKNAASYVRRPPGINDVDRAAIGRQVQSFKTRKTSGMGTVALRGDGRWEARIQVNGRRKGIYGPSREDVELRLKALRKEMCGAA